MEVEAKLAQLKLRRQAVYMPKGIAKADETIEVDLRTELSQDAYIVESLKEFNRISLDTIVNKEPRRRVKLSIK